MIHVRLVPMRVSSLSLWLAVAMASRPASATYSVLLSNIETGELGGAAISCVGDFDLSAIFGYSNRGQRTVGFFAQGLYSQINHERALNELDNNREVADVLEQLTSVSFDLYAAERQYHFLPNDGLGTTWTGAMTLPYAGGRGGSFGPWRYTIAGNILTSDQVLASAEQSLRTMDGSLEERLVTALEAGALDGGGDSRCSPLPGDSAYIEVRDAGGVSRLVHTVVDTRPTDPLVLLRDAVLPAGSGQVDSEATDETTAGTPSLIATSTASPSTFEPTPSEPARATPSHASCAVVIPRAGGWLLSCLAAAALLARRAQSRRLRPALPLAADRG